MSPDSSDLFVPEVVDARYSDEFYRRLEVFLGGRPEDVAPAFQRFYRSWWRDHAGGRSEFFREHMLPALESARPLRGLKVLDFGCGTGSSAIVLAEQGATVVGVEPERVSLDVAERRVTDLGFEDRIALQQIPYLTGNSETLPFADAAFDLATVIGVLEHALPHERRHCVRELARVVKPGGDVFVYDTPNRLFPYDHHTTKLWFVGWLPSRLARAYAVFRGRMDESASFERRGGVGVSRRAIDALFPASRWALVYEKSAMDVWWEFNWAATQTPAFVRKLPPASMAALLKGTVWPLIRASRIVNLRPSAWTASHVLTYRKRA
jgi:ubiquinone/menaquinone biosynthesis C-methylase UbiE